MKYEEIANAFLEKNTDNYLVVVPILTTLCFLVDDDKPPIISTVSAKHMLETLEKSVQSKHSDGSHHFEGWFAYEVCNAYNFLFVWLIFDDLSIHVSY